MPLYGAGGNVMALLLRRRSRGHSFSTQAITPQAVHPALRAAVSRASRSVVENLEGRQLLSGTIQPSASGADTYFAFEAENNGTITNNLQGGTGGWAAGVSGGASGASTLPSQGVALVATASNTNALPIGTVTYSLNVTTPGNYKLYIRDKHDGGGDNSAFVPDPAAGL